MTERTLGIVGRAARTYNKALELRQRWRRTPKGKRRELVADGLDVLLKASIKTHTRGRRDV
jgi:hypothetical protein